MVRVKEAQEYVAAAAAAMASVQQKYCIDTPQPKKKFAWINAKYKITKIVSPHVVELDVPSRIHPEFHVQLLKSANEIPLPSQIRDDTQPPPVSPIAEISNNTEPEQAEKFRQGQGWVRKLLVKWQNFIEPTWESRSTLEETTALDDFEKGYETGDGFEINPLHEAGLNQSKITTQPGTSQRQVGYSLRRQTVTPKQARDLTQTTFDIAGIESLKFMMLPPDNFSTDGFKQIYGLRDAGKSHDEIASQLKISLRQVGHALRRGKVAPKKRNGCSPRLSSEDVDEIENFVKSSSMNRRMTYLELATGLFRHLGVSERVIQSELRKRGYQRHPTHKKPPESEQTKTTRKEWAEAHVHWTVENWMSIL
ncbi:hypothetical protein EPUL_005145 [Erysiphe pulchra]|uniref:Transposase Tc1-like domain-containing protein n=1 Tax=Erysiphe pulchra TaxID=225359 RepID=A0A2S4PMJ6_9PEZI|nr:hypothetical protein EPUL_005145 [Erysiphe pulchra]